MIIKYIQICNKNDLIIKFKFNSIKKNVQLIYKQNLMSY